MNRVVTVDLNDESMSVTDVGVSFSSTIQDGSTGYFIGASRYE